MNSVELVYWNLNTEDAFLMVMGTQSSFQRVRVSTKDMLKIMETFDIRDTKDDDMKGYVKYRPHEKVSLDDVYAIL